MKRFVSNIVEAAPEVLKNCRFSVELSGKSAAIAVGCVCCTVAIIYVTDSLVEIKKIQLGVEQSMQQAEPQKLIEDLAEAG